MKTSPKKLQVAIVGGGICGLYLAWKLSKAGHKITVFERESKIWDKPCSGLISERLKNFIPLQSSVIKNKINSCLIHFPRKTITLNLKPVHFVVNRKKLNENLADLARGAGAKILFNQPINELPFGFDRIIGCDGALSKIREKLLLPKPTFRLGIQTFQKAKNFSNYVETRPIKSGFCWKIPQGEQVEYGAIGPISSIKKDFENFCRKENIDFKEKELKSALIPFSRKLILPKENNITLCGDAASLTKPWSGGGVIWGLTATDILLKNFPDFEKYHREVKQFFELKILKGKLITSLTYFLGNNFPYFLPSKTSRDNDFPLF